MRSIYSVNLDVQGMFLTKVSEKQEGKLLKHAAQFLAESHQEQSNATPKKSSLFPKITILDLPKTKSCPFIGILFTLFLEGAATDSATVEEEG